MMRKAIFAIALALIYLQSLVPAFAGDTQSLIEAVISNPRYYDGKVITVEGEVEKVRFTNAPDGDPYTLFRIEDSENNKVGIYSKGHLPISEGSKVRVVGKFKKEKRYVFYKFKNVIKAKEVEKI